MKTEYHLPLGNRFARWLLRPVFRWIFYILSPIVIIGKNNIPPKGAYIIAINHISLYEAPFIVAFWPIAPEAVGAIDIWQRKGQSLLVRLYRGIPVHRGEYDRQVIEGMLAALRSGRPLLLAPEGGRSHTPGMRSAFPGVAYVMAKAHVPVIPVGIVGTTKDYFAQAIRGKRPKLELNIGKPMVLPEVVGNKEEKRKIRQANADLVMAHIARLLPEEYRGVYAKHPIVSNMSTDTVIQDSVHPG